MKKALFNKASDPRTFFHSEIGPGLLYILQVFFGKLLLGKVIWSNCQLISFISCCFRSVFLSSVQISLFTTFQNYIHEYLKLKKIFLMDSENSLNGQNLLNDFFSKCCYGLVLVDLLISLLTKLSWVSRLKVKVYKNKESFDTHLFASPILITRFGLSVWLKTSPSGHVISKTKQNIASAIFFLTLGLLRNLKQEENLKWNCYTLICCSSINFTFKNTFPFYVA